MTEQEIREHFAEIDPQDQNSIALGQFEATVEVAAQLAVLNTAFQAILDGMNKGIQPEGFK